MGLVGFVRFDTLDTFRMCSCLGLVGFGSDGDAKQTLEIRVEQGEAVRLYIRSKEFHNPITYFWNLYFLRESG